MNLERKIRQRILIAAQENDASEIAYLAKLAWESGAMEALDHISAEVKDLAASNTIAEAKRLIDSASHLFDPDNELATLTFMELVTFRNSFAAKLGKAWIHSDSRNRRRLRRSFSDLLMHYNDWRLDEAKAKAKIE